MDLPTNGLIDPPTDRLIDEQTGRLNEWRPVWQIDGRIDRPADISTDWRTDRSIDLPTSG